MKTTYKEVKQFTTERLLIAIDKAIEFAKENNFQVKGEGAKNLEKNSLTLKEKIVSMFKGDLAGSAYKEALVEKLKDVSPTMKKKINKIIRRLEYKMTRKNINLFFHFLNKRLQLDMPIKFNMSKEEENVVYAREDYKLLIQQLHEARQKYKSLKKGYYGSGKKNTEYVEV